MKKLYAILFTCLFTFTVFSEEFTLFPWGCSQKDVFSYCTNKGWNYSTDTKNKIPSFTVDITSDVTYHDKLIDTLLFMFDDSGNLAAQAVFFEDVLDSTHSFPAVLDLLIADHAQLLSKDFDSGNSYGLNFNALLNNNVSAKYGIRGKDNIYRISILYFKN